MKHLADLQQKANGGCDTCDPRNPNIPLEHTPDPKPWVYEGIPFIWGFGDAWSAPGVCWGSLRMIRCRGFSSSKIPTFKSLPLVFIIIIIIMFYFFFTSFVLGVAHSIFHFPCTQKFADDWIYVSDAVSRDTQACQLPIGTWSIHQNCKNPMRTPGTHSKKFWVKKVGRCSQ